MNCGNKGRRGTSRSPSAPPAEGRSFRGGVSLKESVECRGVTLLGADGNERVYGVGYAYFRSKDRQATTCQSGVALDYQDVNVRRLNAPDRSMLFEDVWDIYNMGYVDEIYRVSKNATSATTGVLTTTNKDDGNQY